MRKTLAVLGISLLTACASTPVDLATAPHVPPDRILASEYFEAGEGKVPVTVSHDAVIAFPWHKAVLSVDHTPLVDIKPGEFVEFYVPQGRRVLSVESGLNGINKSITSDYFEEGSTYKFRLHSGDVEALGLIPD